eukprot:6498295-Prymnesium_polylepis.1
MASTGRRNGLRFAQFGAALGYSVQFLLAILGSIRSLSMRSLAPSDTDSHLGPISHPTCSQPTRP